MAHLCSAYLGKKKTFAQMAKAAKKRSQKCSRKDSEGDDYYGFLRPKSNRPPRVLITVKQDTEEKYECNDILPHDTTGHDTMESLLSLEVNSMHSGYSSMTVPSVSKNGQRSPRSISDLEDLLGNANSLRPANIPMKVITGYKPSTNWAAKDEVAIEQGMMVNALYKQNDWVMVRTPRQRSGFVPYTYVKPLCLTDGANLNHSREFERKPEVYDSITEALNKSSSSLNEQSNGKLVYINDSERFLLDERKSGDGESVESNPSCEDPWSYEDSSEGNRSSIHEMPTEQWINEKLSSSIESVNKEKSEIIGHFREFENQTKVPYWDNIKTMEIDKLSPILNTTSTHNTSHGSKISDNNSPRQVFNSTMNGSTIPGYNIAKASPKLNHTVDNQPKKNTFELRLNSSQNGITLPGRVPNSTPKIMQKKSAQSSKAGPGYLLYLPELDEVKKTIEKLESLKIQSESQVSKSYEKLNNNASRQSPITQGHHLYSGNEVKNMGPGTRDPVIFESNTSISSKLDNNDAFRRRYGGPRMMVLYDYDAMNEDDVCVRRGDVVTLLNGEDEDWIFVQTITEQEGFIPKAYAVNMNNDHLKTPM